jgi:hypothetical protein
VIRELGAGSQIGDDPNLGPSDSPESSNPGRPALTDLLKNMAAKRWDVASEVNQVVFQVSISSAGD